MAAQVISQYGPRAEAAEIKALAAKCDEVDRWSDWPSELLRLLPWPDRDIAACGLVDRSPIRVSPYKRTTVGRRRVRPLRV
jgi:hypothetical protein